MNVNIVLTGRLLLYKSANDDRPIYEYTDTYSFVGTHYFEAAQAIGTSNKYSSSNR